MPENTDSLIHSEKFLCNWAKLALERFLTASGEQQPANQRGKILQAQCGQKEVRSGEYVRPCLYSCIIICEYSKEFTLVLLSINYCSIFHTDNCQPTFAHPSICASWVRNKTNLDNFLS